jgi:hypothetical protein
MITADQLVAHAVGDYILQSDWMASEKTKKNLAALVHGVVYSLPFLLLTRVWWALLIIAGTHAAIDRWRLAKYVCFAKNFFAPPSGWPDWEDSKGNGYSAAKPIWLTTWLFIFTDNIMHVLINGAVLYYVN